jgi:hypothetical protein
LQFAFFCLALPDNFNTPAQLDKLMYVVLIILYIFFKFAQPEIAAAFGAIGVTATQMSMPETTMNKNGSPVFCQHNIRPARQGIVMQSETIT